LIDNHENDETANVSKVAKLSKLNFLLPWGTKLHIGVEDVLVLVNNASKNPIQYDTDSDSFRSELSYRSTMVDKLCLMLQTSCLSRFSEKLSTENVILQSFPLFEMTNDKITKLGNGETIIIENPLMNTHTIRSFSCLPNVVILELLLVSAKEHLTTEIIPSKEFSLTSKSDLTTNHKNKPEMGTKNVGIKFRFNYLMY
jgi:hypothetical protein